MPHLTMPGRYHDCMFRPPSPAVLVFLLGLTLAAPAQDDLRDRVTLTSGRVVTGRVVEPHAADGLIVLQGGKRVRIDQRDVASWQLVGGRVREFFDRRLRHQKSRRARHYLVDWAESAELPGLARLQALELVLEDDSDEELHRFLGHRPAGKGWLWTEGGKPMSLPKLEATMLDRPLRLTGERFALLPCQPMNQHF